MSPSIKSISRHFPSWTLDHCRAYRAGALAGIREASIREGYEYDPEDSELDSDLTLSFFKGYADAVGESVEAEWWYEEIAGWRIEALWWDATC